MKKELSYTQANALSPHMKSSLELLLELWEATYQGETVPRPISDLHLYLMKALEAVEEALGMEDDTDESRSECTCGSCCGSCQE